MKNEVKRTQVSRRGFLRMSGMVTVGAVLAACAPGVAPAGSGGSEAAVEVTDIRLIAWGNPTEVEAREATLDMFHTEHPEIHVDFLHVPDQYLEKLQTMLAGGDIPDVIFLGNGDVPSFSSRNQLAEFDSLIARDNFDTSDIFETNLALYNVDGVQYGFPVDAPSQQLFYNKTRFEEAGVPFPSSDWEDPSWDWATFLAAATALTDKENNQWGWQTKAGNFRAWWIWVTANGGTFFNEDGTECLLNSPAAVDAFQFLGDLIHVHEVSPRVDVAAEMGSAELFESGVTAMETWWPAMGRMRTNIQDFEWDVAPHPQGDVTKAGSGGGTGHTIAKASKEIDAAWVFVTWVVSTPAVEKWTEIMGIVPPLKSVAESDVFLQPGQPPEHISVFTDGAPYLQPDPRHTLFPQARTIADSELEYMWTGEKNAEEVANSMVDKINKLLAEG